MNKTLFSGLKKYLTTGVHLTYLGIFLGVLYWPLEAALHALVFSDADFMDTLLSDDPDEIWMRLIISSAFVAFGLLSQNMLRQQQHSQLQLKRSRDRLQRVIDSTFDAYVSMNQDGYITGWNRSAESMFGWSTREALGQKLSDLIVPPTMRQAHEKGMQKYLASNVGPWLYKSMQTQALCKNGRIINVEMSVIPLLLEDNKHEFFSFIRERD
ncbi:MAG: hypothetical protein AUK35_03515 [Zetaproteobacteria bacterium CG2_30_46_52]|nr:MAG: hypothetical protein AUK35_03515 [Zetaproteobacteria bacterium CG2_30_46_52]